MGVWGIWCSYGRWWMVMSIAGGELIPGGSSRSSTRTSRRASRRRDLRSALGTTNHNPAHHHHHYTPTLVSVGTTNPYPLQIQTPSPPLSTTTNVRFTDCHQVMLPPPLPNTSPPPLPTPFHLYNGGDPQHLPPHFDAIQKSLSIVACTITSS